MTVTGLCRVCGRQRDLCPDGRTVVRHYLDRDVASIKRCRSGRKKAASTTTPMGH